MTVRRIVAPTAREALRRVKEELGPDAIVVANKPVADGVEITAMSSDSLDALAAQTTGRPLAEPMLRPPPTGATELAAHDVDADYTVTLSAKAHAQTPFRPWHSPASATSVPPRPPLRPLPPRTERQTLTPADTGATPRHGDAPVGVSPRLTSGHAPGDAPAAPAAATEPPVAQLMAEMQSIKAMLERQLAGFAWGEMSRQHPVQAVLLGELLDAGFSSALARRLIDDLPVTLESGDGRKWLAGAVNRRLRTLAGDSDIVDQGGVFALVGPTGVGKTTTTAKLAARCVVRYGADRLALLTTDGYRIGAHEQLRIYGRILGVPVHVVRDSEDLRRTLVDLRDKHMILIDTVGMSQRDRMVAEQAAMLTRAGEVRRLLLMNAGARGDTLDDVVRAYAGEELAGCILTKVDEAASLAPALDVVVRHGLLLAYVANGQRVPEDLHLPNRSYLLHRAFKRPADVSPHRLKQDDVGLVMTPKATAAPLGAPLG
ncbi:MAG: flagellar biosynthesis protein FlhF [Rhodocyclaceae bacterium]|nr:flagellar biosynthesis protein FlhF [Rhodocyclaceae bacterium]